MQADTPRQNRADLTYTIYKSRLSELSYVKELIGHGELISKGRGPSKVVDINDGLIVKYGTHVWHSEAQATRLASDRTRIPVPRVIVYLEETSYSATHMGYIVMEKVPGVTLADALENLDEHACEFVAKQLSSIIKDMRTLDSGEWGMVGKHGHFHRGFFKFEIPPCKPSSARQFAEYFADAGRWSLEDEKLVALLETIDTDKPPSFTHGDLVPDNIMVDPATGRITGIIDWELAGWYPYFWNYWIAQRWHKSGSTQKWRAIHSSLFEPYVEAAKSFSRLWGWADMAGCDLMPGPVTCTCCE